MLGMVKAISPVSAEALARDRIALLDLPIMSVPFTQEVYYGLVACVDAV
jgi:hypothetical protein